MVQYLTNSSIESMFPVSFDRPSVPGSNLLSEKNLRRLIKTISNEESFVLSNTVENNKLFEFVIDGYYVSFIFNVVDFSTYDSIYATIFIDTQNSAYPLLHGFEDENGYFRGLVFSDTLDESTLKSPTTLTSYVRKSLKILTKNEKGQFVIPPESMREFLIDGGEYQ